MVSEIILNQNPAGLEIIDVADIIADQQPFVRNW